MDWPKIQEFRILLIQLKKLFDSYHLLLFFFMCRVEDGIKIQQKTEPEKSKDYLGI